MAATPAGNQPPAKVWGADGLLQADARALTRAALSGAGKAVLVAPMFDTIKLVRDGMVEATLDRDTLGWALAWASRAGLEPPADPPPPEWFEGAAVVHQGDVVS